MHVAVYRYMLRNYTYVLLKPQSHRIVRLLDRTIGCDQANVRPIGNVCYDLQKRSHAAIGLFCWSSYCEIPPFVNVGRQLTWSNLKKVIALARTGKRFVVCVFIPALINHS